MVKRCPSQVAEERSKEEDVRKQRLEALAERKQQKLAEERVRGVIEYGATPFSPLSAAAPALGFTVCHSACLQSEI